MASVYSCAHVAPIKRTPAKPHLRRLRRNQPARPAITGGVRASPFGIRLTNPESQLPTLKLAKNAICTKVQKCATIYARPDSRRVGLWQSEKLSAINFQPSARRKASRSLPWAALRLRPNGWCPPTLDPPVTKSRAALRNGTGGVFP
jgi:hypothetical protein